MRSELDDGVLARQVVADNLTVMRIRPFSTPGRFWRGNLREHSSLSDGALNPWMFSDHFLDRFDWPIADTRKLRSNSFTILIGAEVRAMGTSAGEYWHIVATGLPVDFPRAAPNESGPRLAERAREAGALVAIRPSVVVATDDRGRPYNHACAVTTDLGDGFYILDQLCNEERRLTAVVGGDAHFHNGDLDAFGGYVLVKSESLEPESLLGALKAGEFYSTQGPRIYNIELTRDEVRVECSPVHTLALDTCASPAVSRVGRGLTQATIEFAEVTKWAWRDPPPFKSFRIVAIDGPRRRAWTNPIWVDAFD